MEKKVKFELTYNYNNGNPLREMVGLLIQKSYKQVGIKINIQPLEWSLFLDELQKHNCQLWYQGWVSGPGLDDDKQIYHSSSAVDGSNYMNFGNAESDKLLDNIRTELDEENRNKMYLRWQEIENDQLPYIYLYVQDFRNAIHKRFEGVLESSIYPGIWFGTLKVKKEYKVK
jgi:peptide/nickel transport system substrate-binding protein